jgi:membrane-bound metal-dependent hydrolase YbcI (DUF457 family)
MTGTTHRAFSVTFALGGAFALTRFGLSEVNPLVAAPVLIMAARYGALLPDVDHHWDSVADKTVPNRIINGFIHLTGGAHRSWQTHSWDVYIVVLATVLLFPASMIASLGTATMSVFYALVYGVLLGWCSHLFADMLTPQGVRIVCWSRVKVRLVPKWAMFATGSGWEDLCLKTVKVINVFAGIAYIVWCAGRLGFIDRAKSFLSGFGF